MSVPTVVMPPILTGKTQCQQTSASGLKKLALHSAEAVSAVTVERSNRTEAIITVEAEHFAMKPLIPVPLIPCDRNFLHLQH